MVVQRPRCSLSAPPSVQQTHKDRSKLSTLNKKLLPTLQAIQCLKISYSVPWETQSDRFTGAT